MYGRTNKTKIAILGSAIATIETAKKIKKLDNPDIEVLTGTESVEAMSEECSGNYMSTYTYENFRQDIKPVKPITRTEPKTGRNETCPCGSGIKYKKCCM